MKRGIKWGLQLAITQKDYREPRLLTPLLQGVVILQIIGTVCVCAVATYTLLVGKMLVLPQRIVSVYDVIRNCVVYAPLVAVITSLFWIYRVSKNTHAISIQPLRFTPGWAVGWFFVPFANLIQPYFVVSELYNANKAPHDWKSLRRPWIVIAWWLILFLANVLSVAMNLTSVENEAPPQALVVAFFTDVVVHQALALIIYSRIANWQIKNQRALDVNQLF